MNAVPSLPGMWGKAIAIVKAHPSRTVAKNIRTECIAKRASRLISASMRRFGIACRIAIPIVDSIVTKWSSTWSFHGYVYGNCLSTNVSHTYVSPNLIAIPTIHRFEAIAPPIQRPVAGRSP